MRVLLIEDEPEMANLIEFTLASEGIVCNKVSVGLEGLRLGKLGSYDLMILDLMLPDINGFEILLRLRAAKIKTPILILSSLTDTDQKITDFSSGADDYLTKPFVREELIARIKAIVRRSKGHAASVFRFDKVSVNLDTRSVKIDGNEI